MKTSLPTSLQTIKTEQWGRVLYVSVNEKVKQRKERSIHCNKKQPSSSYHPAASCDRSAVPVWAASIWSSHGQAPACFSLHRSSPASMPLIHNRQVKTDNMCPFVIPDSEVLKQNRTGLVVSVWRFIYLFIFLKHGSKVFLRHMCFYLSPPQ